MERRGFLGALAALIPVSGIAVRNDDTPRTFALSDHVTAVAATPGGRRTS